MDLPWRLKLLSARIRRKLRPGPADRGAALRRHAAGRSVLDVGCMWSVNGEFCFLAEDAGATQVSGMDVMEPTPEFEAEHGRRRSKVRFIHGDLHDEGVVAQAGVHDLVWCSGVLYHSPNPLTTLRRLRALCGELLILQTTAVPELPGVAQGMVFYPGLSQSERSLYRMWGPDVQRRSIGPHDEFPDEYSPWWWGITPSALRAMLRSAGFDVLEEWGDPFSLHVLARVRD